MAVFSFRALRNPPATATSSDVSKRIPIERIFSVTPAYSTRREHMKKRNSIRSALAIASIIDDGDGKGVTRDDLAGTWNATSIVFTKTENPQESVDVIPGGASMTLVLHAEGAYAITSVIPPADPLDGDIGTYGVSASRLTLRSSDGSAEMFAIAREGDTMTLTLDDVFGFVEDVEELISQVITLTR